jgi:rubrerythrin
MGPCVPKPPEVVKKEAKAEKVSWRDTSFDRGQKAEKAPRRGTPEKITQDILNTLQHTTANLAIHNVVVGNRPVLATCWTCGTPHQGSPGRCPVCAARFAEAREHTTRQVIMSHGIPAPLLGDGSFRGMKRYWW